MELKSIAEGDTFIVHYGAFNSHSSSCQVEDILYLILWGCIMRIVGLQKMTLLDYPGRVACTVFLGGCNFRCPFCHNGGLLDGNAPEVMPAEELLTFLKGRQGLLDGVCVTGGEPTLSAQLPQLLADIKALGFDVKLDTNGSNPKVLKQLVKAGLVDYVAMDVKNSPDRYAATTGLKDAPLEALEESLRFLMEGHIDYELRTTVVRELHDETSLTAMGQWLYRLNDGRKIPKLFLQPFVQRASVPDQGLTPPETAQMTRFVELLSTFATDVSIRG